MPCPVRSAVTGDRQTFHSSALRALTADRLPDASTSRSVYRQTCEAPPLASRSSQIAIAPLRSPAPQSQTSVSSAR